MIPWWAKLLFQILELIMSNEQLKESGKLLLKKYVEADGKQDWKDDVYHFIYGNE